MFNFKQILLFSCFLNQIAAQTDTVSPVRDLQEVIIQENRLQIPLSAATRSIQIISKTQIQQLPASSLAEVLSFVAGLDIRQRGIHGIQADISVRGGTFDQTLILLNGVKLADPQTGHHALNLPIDLNNIERIEILKGGAARIFGQNAFAGAINIVTKVAQEGAATISLMAGAYSTWGFKAGISLPMKDFFHQLTISSERSDGYRSYNSDYQLDNLFYQAKWKIAGRDLNILSGITTRKFGASGFYAPKDTSSEYEGTQTRFAAVDMPFEIGQWTIKPRLAWRKHEDDYQYYRYAPDRYRNQTKSNVLTAELQTTYKSAYGTTGLGLEMNQTQFESTRLDTHQRTQWSLFAEHRFSWKDWTLTPGVLLTNYSDFGNHAFPGIDLGYQMGRRIRFFANYGASYRVPTYTDLYFKNAANDANPVLKPEKADNYELGLKYQAGEITGSLAFFRRDGSNIIDRTKDSVHHKWLPTNLSLLKTEGLDLDSEWHPSAHPQFGWIKSISLSGTYLTKTTLEKPVALSRYAFDQLNWQINVGIHHTIWKHLSQNIRVRYLDRANLPDYTVVDLKWFWIQNQWNLYLQMTNLLNRAYTESNGIPMPQRWISGGVSYRLKY
jgi:iron complex outermembrane receptor protein